MWNSSLVISWSRDSSAHEFILSRSRSRSRDLKSKVSVLVLRPEDPGLGLGLETWSPMSQSWSQESMLGAYACSTITVICSTFKRVLCHQLELMQPVLWSRDHGLKTRVHFVQVSVSVSVSRPEVQGLGLGLETRCPRSQSWSRDQAIGKLPAVLVSRPKKKVLTTTLWKSDSKIFIKNCDS